MNIKNAIREKENYADIVKWFKERQPLQMDELVLLVDTTMIMSEEIYEYYRALQDICKAELQRIRTAGTVLNEHQQEQLTYVIRKASEEGFILPEKYEGMKKGFDKEVTACKTKG